MGFKVKPKKEVKGLHETINEICIIDFETTGLKAGTDRAIELGIVVLVNNEISEKFQTLINPGINIPEHITEITKITNEMIKDAPKPEDVMVEARRFIKNRPIMAHNVGFDKRFLDYEMELCDRIVSNPWLCTLLLSRRLILDVENYKLPTLAQHFNIVATGAHRALADCITTAELWIKMQKIAIKMSGIEQPDITVFQKLSKKPKKDIPKFLTALGEQYKSQLSIV